MLDSIVSQLEKTAKSDVFCTQLSVPHHNLSLEIEPIGTVKFPISARTAKTLIVEAEPAKFGHRDKTLMDRRVRDVWEISKSHIRTDEEWNQHLSGILKKIQKNLELPEDGELQADLHNMLIYMPGQFFKGHQDSEKEDGMLATLVVLLPSEFSGGELVIDQHGDQKTFRAPPDANKKLTFIAFYSDCHHEVKMVTDGYRVALTYNLIFKTSSKTLPRHKNEKLEKELNTYFSQSSTEKVRAYETKHPRWLVYLLDHQYTQKSLNWQGLRGADRQRAADLLGCAENLGLVAHLALADIHEVWSAEDNWSDHRYRGRRYDDDSEDEEETASNSEDYELVELIEDEIELRHWIDQSGRHLKRKEHFIPRNMVCWTKASDEFRPFSSEYEGYMGNYGNTLDRWYHRAAIVLWKKDSEFANIFTSDRCEALQQMVSLFKKDLAAGQEALKQVLPLWPEHMNSSMEASQVFELASLLQNSETATKLVASLGLESVSEQNRLQLMKLIKAYGEDWGLEQLKVWKKQRDWQHFEPLPKDFVILLQNFSQPYRKISQWILMDRFSKLTTENRAYRNEIDLKWIRKRVKESMKDFDLILRAARALGEEQIHRKSIEFILRHPSLYPAVEAVNLLKDINISRNSKDFERWGFTGLTKDLQRRLEEQASVHRDKEDWSVRDLPPPHCEDCRFLIKFLSNPRERKLIWPLAKTRRQHIHQVVDGLDLPITHATLREGSPQKLVLTKTPGIFTKEKAQIKAAEEGLSKLRKFLQQ